MLSVVGAAAIGAGWILQHRPVDPEEGGSPDRRLTDLMREPWWWAGIAAMSAGQTLTGFALQHGAITLVAPLLSTNLLCAFLVRAAMIRHRPLAREVVGGLGMIAAVTAFVLIGGPHVSPGQHPAGLADSVVGTAAVGAIAVALLAAGARRRVAALSVTAALAAGLLYGMQDVATRATLVLLDRDGPHALVATVWPYLLLAAATVAVLLTQRAFRAARLDYALPPIAASQPAVGIALGIPLLGDRLDLTVPALAVEAVCSAVLIGSTVLLARSTALTNRARSHRRGA